MKKVNEYGSLSEEYPFHIAINWNKVRMQLNGFSHFNGYKQGMGKYTGKIDNNAAAWLQMNDDVFMFALNSL